MARGGPACWGAALLLCLAAPADAEQARLNTLKDIFTAVSGCWKPPPPGQANPIDITVIVSFRRDGTILGHPRISYESTEATDNDRLQYRTAVMETLQRCTPLPFTEGLGGAVAGRPFTLSFKTRKRQPKADERRAWLLQKIL
jgi:hypothetical protein